MKKVRVSIFCLVLALFCCCSEYLAAQPVEQTLARLFSYDPHPATADFADKVPFNGQMADVRVKFSETWSEKKDTAYISAISFSVSAIKNGATLGSADTRKVSITPNMSKGQNLGQATLGNLSFKATLDSLEKDSGGVTDVTVVFSLVYQMDDLNSARNSEANQASASSMTLCTSLAKKADALPNKNVRTKISLYEKALMAAPPESASPAAAEFRNMIMGKIAALKGDSPATIDPVPQTRIITPAQKPITPVFKPVTTTKTAAKTVNPKAKSLYQEAKNYFSQDKGPEGREALRKALEIAPDYYDALVLLGENAFSNRKYSRAKEAFDKALNLDGKNAETMLKYFKACYYLGEGNSAIERMLAIKNQYPQDRKIKLTLSEAYFQLGDLPNARLLCEEVLAADSGNYQAKDLLKRIDRLMN